MGWHYLTNFLYSQTLGDAKMSVFFVFVNSSLGDDGNNTVNENIR